MSLSSDDGVSIAIPNTAHLTATTAEALQWPEAVVIYDDTGHQELTGCLSGTTCHAQVQSDLSSNDPRTTTYHAAIIDRRDWSTVFESSAPVTIAWQPLIFDVDFETGTGLNDTGDPTFIAEVTVAPAITWPFVVVIIDDTTGSTMTGCFSGTYCRAQNLDPNHRFHAEVQNRYSGAAFGKSNDADIVTSQLASLFATSMDVCVLVAAMPAQTRTVSSLGDLGTACLGWQQAGMTTAQIAARVAFFGSAAALAWLLYTATAIDDGTLPPPPSTVHPPVWPPPGVPRPAEPPSTLPDAWARPIGRASAGIKSLNPDVALTDTEATEIARRCLWLAAADQQGFEICHRPGLPIFVSGAENPEPAIHDLEALGTPEGIGWFRLNYRRSADQLTTSPRSWWSSADPRCTAVASSGGTLNCDEFPFFATEQGGRYGVPQPSIKALNGAQNQDQGRRYGKFLWSCKMHTGTLGVPGSGAMFLIVPIPAVVPTKNLCNGKS